MAEEFGLNQRSDRGVYFFSLCRQEKRRRAVMENNIEILLVEDTPSDVRLTQEALKRSGLKYTMSVVNDGVEAMDYLNERKTGGQQMPDLILLDLNMPRKNGHEVLADVQA